MGYTISEERRDGTPKREDDLQGMGEGAGGGGGRGGWELLGSEPHKELSTDELKTSLPPSHRPILPLSLPPVLASQAMRSMLRRGFE